MTSLVTVIGWLAAVVVLASYALLTSGRLAPSSVPYLAMNAVGAIGLALSTAVAHAWPSSVVNIIWLVIGIRPLARAWFTARATAAAPSPRAQSAAPATLPPTSRARHAVLPAP
jgi:hypothetical protein